MNALVAVDNKAQSIDFQRKRDGWFAFASLCFVIGTIALISGAVAPRTIGADIALGGGIVLEILTLIFIYQGCKGPKIEEEKRVHRRTVATQMVRLPIGQQEIKSAF